MIPLSEVALIFGTAATVGAAVAASGRWVVRAIFREDVEPLRDTMMALKHTVETLVEEMRESRDVQRSDRNDMHEAVEKLTTIVQDHESRVRVLESQQTPKKPAPRSRVARG